MNGNSPLVALRPPTILATEPGASWAWTGVATAMARTTRTVRIDRRDIAGTLVLFRLPWRLSDSIASAGMDRWADPEEDAALADYGRVLVEVADSVIVAWVIRCVTTTADRWRPGAGSGLVGEAEAAGEAARTQVIGRLRELLATDVSLQRSNPLDLIRESVSHPTSVLSKAGVPPVQRDEFASRMFPDDIYDLGPASFADIDPALADPGLRWGAAKAHVVLARRRRMEA